MCVSSEDAYPRLMACLGSVLQNVAAQQGGVIRRQQLLDGGVAESVIRRAADRRILRRIAPGLFVDAGAPATESQHLWIAHLALGSASVVSHESAGRVWELVGVKAGRATVTVPHVASPRPTELCTVYRTRRLDDVDVASSANLPVTTPARTIVDLARLYGPARLGAVVDQAHFERIATIADIGNVLQRLGLRGLPGCDRLVQVLDERSAGAAQTHSVLERLLGQVLALAGIEDFTRQHPLPSDGPTEGWVDVYVALARLIIEADGRRWHSRQADMRRDRERDLAAAEHGIMTVRFLYEQLRDQPEQCAERLARVVAARRGK